MYLRAVITTKGYAYAHINTILLLTGIIAVLVVLPWYTGGAVEDGTLTEERINQSVRRILKMKKQIRNNR